MYLAGEGLIDHDEFLSRLSGLVSTFDIVKTNKKIEFYNIPAAFDIETSSFYEGAKNSENKRSVMYIWQLGIYNLVTTGRTWDSLKHILKQIEELMLLSPIKRLVIYVHNLPYEFQFIRKHFEWSKVFLLSDRKPVYCINDGFEFRCSLKLAGGKSLESVGKDLLKYPVEKAVGKLDYNIIRTPLTTLTASELEYCEKDIRVLLHYIQEKIEIDGDITKIPLTNTGYVRNHCRKACFKSWKKYHNLISNFTVDLSEYSQLKRSYMGGFTHANARYVNQVLTNVGSHDFNSSYPAAMVLEKFPMSTAKLLPDGISIEELENYFKNYCCMFDCEILDIMPKLYHEQILSRSKCWICENATTNNGRVVMASRVCTTMTEQDYFAMCEFYTWEQITIKNVRYYHKNYLPKNLVRSILELYEKKTALKGIEEEELNYMIAKNMLNAAYGMMVTDPVKDDLIYDMDNFYKVRANIMEALESYNKNIRRFLFYPWGVWTTAYSRANLFSGIIEMGQDYVYSDTDSIKSLNTSIHADYFNLYNNQIEEKIKLASEHHKIDINLFKPFDRHGKQRIIGVWDDEGEYSQFKTLGAKRYLVTKEGKYQITLAGANKKKTMQYLEGGGSPFKEFTNDLKIPANSSGRLILTYIDEETEGIVMDCQGNIYHYHELSSIHMEPSEYHLSIANEFIKYIKGIQDFGE